jgi:hypothetical protein
MIYGFRYLKLAIRRFIIVWGNYQYVKCKEKYEQVVMKITTHGLVHR